MTKKEAIFDFLSQKKFAIIGVSRNSRKFGNAILKDMRKKGYHLIPVHPEADKLEGEKCYKSLSDIPFPVDGAILNIKPDETEKVVEDINSAGIKRVWMQQGSGSKKAIEYCINYGISVISGECIFMFAQPMEFFHRAHRWVWGVIGKLPA
jgi:predicted CoA-binding protein